MRSIFCFLLLLLSILISCEINTPGIPQATSPDGNLLVSMELDSSGVPAYSLVYKGDVILDYSQLGFTLAGQEDLVDDFKIVSTSKSTSNTTWETLWGEVKEVACHYNEIVVELEEKKGDHRRLKLVFRLFDDGIGFRYEIPEQEGLTNLVITDELTHFNLTGDHTAWWIPADYDSYEYLFTESKLSEIDNDKYKDISLAHRSVLEQKAVHTPLTMKVDEELYMSIHEAALTDYTEMTLRVEDGYKLAASLVPNAEGTKARVSLPFTSPWRTIQVATSPGGLIESQLILNLNEANKIAHTDWIQPMKYMGIWWGMHLQKYDWKPGPKLGATTENAKAYIDFAAEHGIPGMLIEGWNEGWQYWGSPDYAKHFDLTKPQAAFDMDEIVAYGKEKGVSLIGHHETGSGVDRYDEMVEDAMAFYKEKGVIGVKTGYVGKIKPEGEYHHGQWMINHYRHVVETAAKNQISVFAHEPIKATGIRRTWPNMMAREGLRGSEFNSPWGGGNPPEHLPTIAFTRMLAGPIDYTPGIVRFDLDEFKPGYRVPTTLCYQLASFVVIYSPVQMASDLPEHYAEKMEAFQFIKDVAVDWEESKVLNGEIGRYVTIARKERGADNWFIGSLTDREGRELTISLDFLEEGKSYKARIYRDGPDASWQANNEQIEIEEREVNASTQLTMRLAPGGGQAISIMYSE